MQDQFRCLESGGAGGHESRASLSDTVGKREAELGHKQLLDVWTTDVCRLLDLDHSQDLYQPQF